MTNKKKNPSFKLLLAAVFLLFFITIPSVTAKEFLGRGLICLPKDGSVYCSWRLLPVDAQNVGFDVYRDTSPIGPFSVKVNNSSITSSTNFHDTTAVSGTTYYYKVKPLGGEFSELSKVTAGPTKNYVDIYKNNSSASSSIAKPGDLNGDGVIDFVALSPGSGGSDCNNRSVIQAEGIINEAGTWKSKWTFNTEYIGCDALEYIVWDLDGDGKAEVIGSAGLNYDIYDLVVLNGETGQLLARHKHAYHPNQIYGVYPTIARLKDMNGDGIADPFIVTSQGTYGSNHRLAAYYYNNKSLERVYDLTISAAASGRGSHGLPAADIDLDGKDEVLLCGLVLDDDFTIKFEANKYHNDACYPGEIVPSVPGLETFMGTEMGYIAQLVNKDGNNLWVPPKKVSQGYDGWEQGWCSELKTGLGYEGLECFAYEQIDSINNGNTDGVQIPRIFTSGGRDITHELIQNPNSLGCGGKVSGIRQAPIDWHGGDGVKELYFHGNPPDIPPCSASWYSSYLADILGDSREEVVTPFPGGSWTQGYFRIYINNNLNTIRYITPLADRDYRASVMRVGVGYRTNYIASKSGQHQTDVVYTSGAPQRCTSFEYSPEACQPNGKQKLNIVSVSPLGCVGGTPSLSQSCTYIPHICNEIKTSGTYFDAENFTGTIPSTFGAVNFSVASAQSGYLGTGYLKAGTSNESKEYELFFAEAGKYSVWIRGFAYDGNSDSIHFGLDGQQISAFFETSTNKKTWKWINFSHPDYSPGINTITIGTPGIHKFNIWSREANFLVDGIYLVKLGGDPSDLFHGTTINPTTCAANPADVNQDTRVNIKDIQEVIRCIININSCAFPGRSNVNGDGNVNIKDIQEIIKKIINQN